MSKIKDGDVVDFVRIITEDVMLNNPGSSFSPEDQLRLHKTIKDAMELGYDSGVHDTANRYAAITIKIKEELS